jgi:DUF971 family protein
MDRKLKLPLLGQPDPSVPKDVRFVGRYALGVDWADGHGSIYPFERLRRDCPCGECAGLERVAPDMAWPAEVTRMDGGLRVRWSDGHASVYPYPDLRALCRCAACTGGH